MREVELQRSEKKGGKRDAMEQKAGNVAMMHHACSGRMATERVA